MTKEIYTGKHLVGSLLTVSGGESKTIAAGSVAEGGSGAGAEATSSHLVHKQEAERGEEGGRGRRRGRGRGTGRGRGRGGREIEGEREGEEEKDGA